MHVSTKPPIHLWIYNHPFSGISDQVDFFLLLFQQQGYSVSVGKRPIDSHLNVVIENFSTVGRETFVEYCESTGKRVAVIMTEHLDLKAGRLIIHGEPLWSDNDYMHPATQVARIKHLFECVPYIRAMFVLGDLPRLGNVKAMLPGLDVRWLPFPKLKDNVHADHDQAPTRDLLFTGGLTEFRESVVALLKAHEFDVLYPPNTVSRNRRNALNQTSRIVLNIPQRDNWRWLSLMRIVAGLRCGRATVSLKTKDDSEISACTPQISLSDPSWSDCLRDYVHTWKDTYHVALERYSKMAENFAESNPFPHDLIELWAITDRITLHKK